MLHNFPILSVYARQGQYDPTRTTSLRNAFAKDMDARFRKLQAAIIKKIVADDCFGLNDKEHQITLMSGEFNFVRSADKVAAFMAWVEQQVAAGLFTVADKYQLGSSIESIWSDYYIKDSYQRGVERARYDLAKAGYGVPSMTASGGIQAVMTTPLHMDRVGVVYARAYSELKGITSAMDKQISQVLAKGIIDGENPKALARALVKTISGIGGDLSMTDSLGRFIPARRRAAMLARTEIIRAHHQGQVQEMRNWSVAGVKVKAEWVTAGYNVCPKCAENNGKQYTLDEIEPLIPFHPNCRCAIIPIDQTGKDEKKKDTPAPVSTPAPKEAGADKARIRFQKEKITKSYNIEDIGEFGTDSLSEEKLLQSITAIGEELQRLENSFPGLSSSTARSQTAENLPGRKLTILLSERPLGEYDPRLNELKMGAVEITGKQPIVSSPFAWNSVEDDDLYVFRHEYGHAVHNQGLNIDAFDDWFALYKSKGKTFWAETVSEYGSTSASELFAESFACYTIPSYKKGTLPKEVEAFFANLMERIS